MLKIVYQSIIAELIQVSPCGGNLYKKSGSGSPFYNKKRKLLLLIAPGVRLNTDPDE